MNARVDKFITSKFARKCDRFCNSVWYIFAMGLVCVIAHSFDIPVIGVIMLLILLVPALLFCENSFVLVPFALMCAFVMSKETEPKSGYFNTPFFIVVLSLSLAIALAAFAFNIIYYKKWKKMFKRGYLTVSLALVSGFLIAGGLGAPSFSLTGVGLSLAISVTMFLPYTMIINCAEYDRKKTTEYFAWTMITISVVIFLAVIKQYIIHDLSIFTPDKSKIVFGYAISNTAAAYVLIAMPITFYMVYKYKHGYLFLIAVAVELITITLTFSRASFIVAAPGTLIVATALCFKKKNGRLWYWIAYGIAIVAAIVIIVLLRQWIIDTVKQMLDGNFTGSGRTVLWKSGFEAWKSYPIFGLGIWYLPPINDWYYSFHCTPLTYLYCAGAVGLAAYLYHRYKTVRLVFKAKLTSERVFVALSVLAMLCNALLDIAMTLPHHLLYYGVMLALIECDVNSVKAETASAPDANGVSTSDKVSDNKSDDNSDNNENISKTNNIQENK